MDLPINQKELNYIILSLWKCRKNAGEPECNDLYEKLKDLKCETNS